MRRSHALGWALAVSLMLTAGLACTKEKKNSDTGSGTSDSSQEAPRDGSAPRADF